MRAQSIGVIAAITLAAAACVSVVAPPTPGATVNPTEPPTPAPTEEPTTPPTPELTNPPTNPPTASPAPGASPRPTPFDLLPFLSSGINLYNLGDTTLYVTASGINADTQEEFKLGVFQIEPEGFTRQSAIPLLLRFDFTFDEGNSAGLATCTMTVESGDEVDFVAVNTGVVVTKNGVEPDTIAEMNTTTSTLCAPGPSQ